MPTPCFSGSAWVACLRPRRTADHWRPALDSASPQLAIVGWQGAVAVTAREPERGQLGCGEDAGLGKDPAEAVHVEILQTHGKEAWQTLGSPALYSARLLLNGAPARGSAALLMRRAGLTKKDRPAAQSSRQAQTTRAGWSEPPIKSAPSARYRDHAHGAAWHHDLKGGHLPYPTTPYVLAASYLEVLRDREGTAGMGHLTAGLTASLTKRLVWCR